MAQLEHINTNQSNSPNGHELKLERTLQHVDIENRFAFKGDDSDGKIEWNIRKLFASAFLAMLYTGTSRNIQFSARRCQAVTDTANRIADSPVFCGRQSHFHCKRSRNLSWPGLAADCQHSCDCRCCTVCWISPRSLRKALYRTLRSPFTVFGMCNCWHGALVRSSSGWDVNCWSR